MDEARFGTHSKLGHGWFATGKRSRVSIKLGFDNFYTYSAVEPSSGEAVSLILPKINTEAMNLFLLELSQTYKDDKLTLVLDDAGWHKSKKLIIPANIHIIHLPPYSPELNPVERLWLYVKSNTIRNKIYDSIDALRNEIANFLNTITAANFMNICSVDWCN